MEGCKQRDTCVCAILFCIECHLEQLDCVYYKNYGRVTCTCMRVSKQWKDYIHTNMHIHCTITIAHGKQLQLGCYEGIHTMNELKVWYSILCVHHNPIVIIKYSAQKTV